MTPTLTDERFNQTVAIARTYLESHAGTMPPMIVGFNEAGEYLALLGTFRDFQEQLTYCALVRMGFVLHNIKEYFVLTHGNMTEEVGKETRTSEVIMSAGVASDSKRGKVFQVVRDNTKELTDIHEEMEFDVEAGANLDGMFMNVLPEKLVVLPEDIKASVEAQVAQIRYIAPEVSEQLEVLEVTPEIEEPQYGVSKLQASW